MEYLRNTRRGLWSDRSALTPLALPGRDCILDAGAGTGGLTTVLREESSATIVALDADQSLLTETGADHRVRGDATRLPFIDSYFDLVTCQALLINLANPAKAIGEFARVSSDLVAAIEPDNTSVHIESTVDAEPALAQQAREAFISGLGTDITLGETAAEHFRSGGLRGVSREVFEHVLTVEPPYDDVSLKRAARQANGDRLAAHRETMLNGSLSLEEFDDLLDAWQSMGRDVAEQMQDGTYRRTETVPMYVTVGAVH